MRVSALPSRSIGLPAAGGFRRRLGGLIPYCFIGPLFALAALFIYWPVAQVLYLSVHDWNLINPSRDFIGLDNYRAVLNDRDLVPILRQSAIYVGIGVVGNALLPIGLALLTIQVADRSAQLYQTLLFTPTVIATSVGALLWQWMYLPNGGLLNAAIEALGFSGQRWLGDPQTALGAIGVVAVWKFLGFNYLVALAGLKAIPRDVLEAARIDGAAGWQLLRGVVMPLLAPTVLFIVLTAVLQALSNAFVPIQVLTQGGPSDATSNLLYDIYQTGFQFFQAGKASAESVLTLILFAVVAVWYFRVVDRRVAYDR